MERLKSIISLLIVLSVLNVIVGKTTHELFEHEHEIDQCEMRETTHFCEKEIAHPDFICNFNFSVSLLKDYTTSLEDIIFYQESKVKAYFLQLTKDLCTNLITLRGPPVKV